MIYCMKIHIRSWCKYVIFTHQDTDKWPSKWRDANIQFQEEFAHLALRVYIAWMSEERDSVYVICIEVLLSSFKLYCLTKVARL